MGFLIIFMRKSPRPYSAVTYAKTRSKLKNLIQQAQKNTQLLDIIRTYLPPKLAPHCIAAEDRQGTLHIMLDSPAWASQLRFMSTKTLKILAVDHYCFKKIVIKVNLEHQQLNKKPAKIKKKRTLPAEAVKSLQDLAASISNPKLKASLLRLSQHGK